MPDTCLRQVHTLSTDTWVPLYTGDIVTFLPQSVKWIKTKTLLLSCQDANVILIIAPKGFLFVCLFLKAANPKAFNLVFHMLDLFLA